MEEEGMATRFRNRRDEEVRPPGLDLTPGGSGGTAAVVTEANHFLMLGDELTNRTLSGDSLAHNRAGSQRNGQ
jgi:hypothetical protein